MKLKYKYIGNMVLEDTAIISDPTYSIDSNTTILNNVLPGEYNCDIIKFDDSIYGEVITYLTATHTDVDDVGIDFDTLELISADIGVDSARCGIFNYEYFKQFTSDKQLVNSSWDILGAKIVGNSVISRAGYGDGTYRAWVKRNDEGKIVFICVDFR